MSAGKGDKQRPADGEKYRSGHDRAFKPREGKQKTKDKKGER